MSLYELGQEDKKRDRQVEGHVRVCLRKKGMCVQLCSSDTGVFREVWRTSVGEISH